MTFGNLALAGDGDDAPLPDLGYQRGGAKAFPAWVPIEVLPAHVESLCEQVSAHHRGNAGTRDPWALFADEEREVRWALATARRSLEDEVPL